MAGTVAMLLKANPQQHASKPAKPSRGDDAGDEFKAELGRAKRKQTDETGDRHDHTKKADKATLARKTQAKGKSRKPDDQEPDQTAPDETQTTGKTNPSAKPTSDTEDAAGEVTTDTPAETSATDETKQPEDASAETDAVVAALNATNSAQSAPNELAPTSKTTAEAAPVSVAKAVLSDASTAIADATEQTADDVAADPAAVKQPADSQAESDQLVADQADQAVKPNNSASGKSQAIDPSVESLVDDSKVAIQPKAARAKTPVTDSNSGAAPTDAALAQIASDLPEVDSDKQRADKPTDVSPSLAVSPGAAGKLPSAPAVTAAKVDQPQLPPEARFAEANHTEIVKGIQTQLMPRGGTMQIRLDPPELGALQVILTVKDGVMNATFQTSSDDSSKLLSHSLGQLKTALETAGVTVDKLQVTHAPRDTQTNAGGDDQRHQPGQDDMSRQQEQQRKEMIKRMWRKLAGESDPLDLVA